MCLLIFAHQTHPQYPLLVAANRDEFHERETARSRFWEGEPTVLAGRDLEMGGTWMGTTRSGLFAAVTNFRDPSSTGKAPRSRGELPLGFLLGQTSPENYLHSLKETASDYAGFNLLVGTTEELWYFSNNPLPDAEQPDEPRSLPPGLYGLSNAHLDTPWPKVKLGKHRLQELLSQHGRIEHAALLQLVSDTQLSDPGATEDTSALTEMEHLLSAQFIRTPTYGTRSSTTLWRTMKGETSWQELSFDPGGEITGTTLETFAID